MTFASGSSRCKLPRRGSPSSATSSARTATVRSRRSSSVAHTACAGSRTPAPPADARSIRAGGSARSAKRRLARRPPRDGWFADAASSWQDRPGRSPVPPRNRGRRRGEACAPLSSRPGPRRRGRRETAAPTPPGWGPGRPRRALRTLPGKGLRVGLLGRLGWVLRVGLRGSLGWVLRVGLLGSLGWVLRVGLLGSLGWVLRVGLRRRPPRALASARPTPTRSDLLTLTEPHAPGD